MGSTDVLEEWGESDRARRRKADGQENKVCICPNPPICFALMHSDSFTTF